MDHSSNTKTRIEELYVYALLCAAGYNEFPNYRRVLEDLFSENLNDDELLDLMGREYKDAILHTMSLMNTQPLDQNYFGCCLMSSLISIYSAEDIRRFGENAYKLWTYLPDDIKNVEPFFTFCYADDCLDYSDEKQCRGLYEKALNFYNDTPNENTVFHNIRDLYKKMQSESFRGKLELNGEWIWWELPEGMAANIAIQPNNFEGYIEIYYYTRNYPKSTLYVRLLDGKSFVPVRGDKGYRTVYITHWHPEDDELYPDLLSINNGNTFLVKGKYFLKYNYYVTSTERWERKRKHWGWLFEKVE